MPAPVLSTNALNPLQVNKAPATGAAKARVQEDFSRVFQQQEAQNTRDKTAGSVKNSKTQQQAKADSQEPANDNTKRDTVTTKPEQTAPAASDAVSAKQKSQDEINVSDTAEKVPADKMENLPTAPEQLAENSPLDIQNWLGLNLQLSPSTADSLSSTQITTGEQGGLNPADESILLEDQLTTLAFTLRQMQQLTQGVVPTDLELEQQNTPTPNKLLGLNSFDLNFKAPVIATSEAEENNLQGAALPSINPSSLNSVIPAITSKFAGELADAASTDPEQTLLSAAASTSESHVGLNSEGKAAAHTSGVQSLQANPAGEAKTFLQLRFNQQTLAQDLVEKTGWLIEHKLDTAHIQLDPPELGPIAVKIHSHQDQVSVSFVVNNQQVRDTMDQSLQRLKEMLAEQGVMLAHADVNSQQQNQDGRNQAEGVGKSQEDADPDITQTIEIAEPQSGIDHFV